MIRVFSALENRLKALIENIFGQGAIEYNRYRGYVTGLNKAPIMMGGTPLHVVIEGLHEGKASVLHHLREIVELFKEEIGDHGTNPASQALRAYKSLDLHPEIHRAAGDLYRDGHYTNAIEDAVKALNALVRLRSGEDTKDGTTLMEYVFSPKTQF